jgi:hypothetical protein
MIEQFHTGMKLHYGGLIQEKSVQFVLKMLIIRQKTKIPNIELPNLELFFPTVSLRFPKPLSLNYSLPKTNHPL